ncbi:unnamed protein product [Haemonchus placei]|uniref:Ion_trans_2 domain-containing protein n=1 Tax=Haemonchus placei TaxID=6290 RepID=A0A0N4X1T2_HAEPC|nr:unnamed protein product [Haemonchus placei]
MIHKTWSFIHYDHLQFAAENREREVIHVYDLSFFLFTTGLGSIPEGASRLLAAVFCSLFAQSLCLLALQFVYRYVQVVRPSARFLFDEKSYLPIALYVITAFDYGAVCFFNFAPSPVKDVYFSEQMWYSYQLNVTDIGYLGPIYVVRIVHTPTELI